VKSGRKATKRAFDGKRFFMSFFTLTEVKVEMMWWRWKEEEKVKERLEGNLRS
jgi:hypothetical protein